MCKIGLLRRSTLTRNILPKSAYDVNFKPWWRQHVVDEVAAWLAEAPVVRDLAQLVPDHVVVCVEHRIHVAVQAEQVVHSVHVKFDFNKVIRVCYRC